MPQDRGPIPSASEALRQCSFTEKISMAPACARRLHDQVPKLESQALEKGKAAAESCLVLGSHVVPHFDCLSLSVCLSACLPACLSVCLSVCV